MINDYKNDFGELNKEGLTLIINQRKQTINIINLVRITFVKKQMYHINFIAFLLAVFLILFVKNNTLSNFIQLMIITSSIILIIITFYFKEFEYSFILIKKNFFINIKVKKKLKKDAQELAMHIVLLLQDACGFDSRVVLVERIYDNST
ncbi:hypothetical protein [Flavobacterium franklandianum]|uniref:Uncharacterized protein n=1 Tax=Flavobacterium franklandianum TaxID=2594430 RepID=A0A553C611_9FLAO|nr:hypothetical protein [Flavobacterium franklandianum]TRX15970.1 hypothetical protein FNW17_15540 [Flavobacterium franklandianum]